MTLAYELILVAFSFGHVPLSLVPKAPMRFSPGVVRYCRESGEWVAR